MAPDPRDEAPTQKLQLPDGRTLAYAEYGDPDGTPVFSCHGLPGSRISGQLGHDARAVGNGENE